MPLRISIALRLPNARHADRYFSFRLHPGMQVPPPCVYKTVSTLFVVSDIKEHFRSFHKLLIKHRIIDKYFQWTFAEGHLVVLGNSHDGHTLTTEYLWFLYDLEQKARLQGGYVHFLPGFHEIMHINGAWRNEHPPYVSATTRVHGPVTALYDANFELRRWLGTRNIIEKIGPYLFLHGDVLSALKTEYYNIPEINNFARQVYTRLPEMSSGEIQTIYPNSSDIFFRYPGSNDVILLEKVNDLLEQNNLSTIISSQAQLSQINTDLEGKLIKLVTHHEPDNPTGLLLKQGEFLQADRQGRKEKINL